MKLRQFVAIFATAMSLASVAGADTVMLKNGDRLTGTVEVSDGKDVTLKTDFAGEIKIQWSAVQELKTDKPIYVVTPDKKTVSGTVSTDGLVPESVLAQLRSHYAVKLARSVEF